MKKLFIVAGSVFIFLGGILGLLWAETATDFIRQKQGNIVEDPLILAFKESLAASKLDLWEEVDNILSNISPAIQRYTEKFGVDLKAGIQNAVSDRNKNKTAKIFAHVVFLGMRDNFAAATTHINNYTSALAYLKIAQTYYDRVLAGNIKRKKPAVHFEIVRLFAQAEFALGNSNSSEINEISPDLKLFSSSIKKIEAGVRTVYTYFDTR